MVWAVIVKVNGARAFLAKDFGFTYSPLFAKFWETQVEAELAANAMDYDFGHVGLKAKAFEVDL